ncbi:probable 28S rRNA (cytosine-C(5))-methyltransferase [Amborella trichopoda]|uniref:SAM-dependent MTase RsmB/NOP-type domain-containing protein n=1 Tax=Amborella trichopoda TaxID=13333 RepID=W1PA73_AMBTC|nr:probable 28S rRNA (cytosine-C(5))-methyltransferase [Amborella trichopoda]ERN04823.1 hypothetical protein AMTR_s00146p00028980 [Amborella trichopoda]|eukprot:XP_006843148.1 probable 28S rRNA (cytosine-C(5))-methyltransferase [Amborella trichopoda]
MAAKKKPTPRRGGERSAYFARREAAKVLRSVLNGDAKRKAVASIKSLVYSPSIKNKKATFALVCQTLKNLPLLKKILAKSGLLKGKWKRQGELIYVVTYDVLFGQAAVSTGVAEQFVLKQKNALQSALVQLCAKKNVKNVEDLLKPNYRTLDHSRPRYVRVNSLKIDVGCALQELAKTNEVKMDDLVLDLLVLPPGTDLHDHPLVLNGSVFLQSKASCMPAIALGPEPGWMVLDACSAPGNKTAQLTALMQGRGKVIACELHKDRIKVLEDTIKRSGASNVEILHEDFLKINMREAPFSKVRAILLDPSCSGSGTAIDRLDHLLPSYGTGLSDDDAERERAKKLAAFQSRALAHALSFPSVERVVYSTCSIHQIENEDVVNSVLPLAASLNFELASPFPQWPRRGLPVFEGSSHLVRTDMVQDKEGFFIALFVRKKVAIPLEETIKRVENLPESLKLNNGSRKAGPRFGGFTGSIDQAKNSTYRSQFKLPFCPFLKMSQRLLFSPEMRYKKPKNSVQYCA